MTYKLQFILKVYDTKYRELINVLEKVLGLPNPDGCLNRMAMQSINNMHLFEYIEEWGDIDDLKKYLNSNEFLSMRGGFRLLTSIERFRITEIKEVVSH